MTGLRPTPKFEHAVVVSPSSSGNSLGRSLVVARVAARLSAHTELIAVDDGPLWGPAAAGTMAVHVGDSAFVKSRLDSLAGEEGPLLVVAVKPEAASASLVRRWSLQSPRRPVFWFDEDDHDVAIAQYWTDRAPRRQKITSQVTNANAPWRLRRRMRWWSQNADVITASSPALATELALPYEKTAILPHVREAVPYQRPLPGEQLRIGFLGTPVAYKGLEELVHLLQVLPTAVLHVFDGAAGAFTDAGVPASRLRVHPGARTAAVQDAMREVDIVALPQDAREKAARFQLPAKLLDALQYGRPALVSSTPVTDGFTHAGISRIDDWFDSESVASAVRTLGDVEQRAQNGAELAAWCAAEFSIDHGVARVEAVLRGAK